MNDRDLAATLARIELRQESHESMLKQVLEALLGTATHAALLRAIAQAFCRRLFTTAELQLRALASDGAGDALARAIAATGKQSTRALGRYLAQRAGVPVAGLVLERVGEDGDGIVWAVRRVSEAETQPGA